MAEPYIASTVELSPAIEEAIAVFAGGFDQAVMDKVPAVGLHGFSAQELAPIWSMYPVCGLSEDLAMELHRRGVDARTVINEKAFTAEHRIVSTLSGGIAIGERKKSHLIVRAQTEAGVVYIDPTWQQFLCDIGQTIERVQRNLDKAVMPTERVICYRAEDVDDIASWFAQVGRVMQNRALRHRIGGDNDMFTRVCTDVDIVLGANKIPPVSYYSVGTLEVIAKQIWDPANYVARNQ